MRLERLNNLPLNTVTPNFVAVFVFFGTACSFIERISFSEIEGKREAILFLFGCSEVNSTWIITSWLANHYLLVWYLLICNKSLNQQWTFLALFSLGNFTLKIYWGYPLSIYHAGERGMDLSLNYSTQLFYYNSDSCENYITNQVWLITTLTD